MHPLVHLAIIWMGVFVAAVAAKKTRLTPVLFFLFVGFTLVNFGVLPEVSGDFIREFAELGIIFIMFSLGFDESPDHFLESLRKSWGIALFGAIAPFAVAFIVAEQIWHDLNISLMFALTMTATAVSLTMVSLRSEGLQNSVVATRIMTSAVLDDIGALVLVAILVPFATENEPLTIVSMLATGGKAALFFVVVTVVGAWIFPHEPKGWFRHVPIIGKRGVRHLLTFDDGRYATLAILLVALVVGLAAIYFGFHPAVGAYMAGLIVKEEYFSIDETAAKNELIEHKRSVYEDTKAVIDDAAFSWIGPVFFVDLGAKLLFDFDVFVEVLPYAAVLTVSIFVVQIASAGLAARYTGGVGNAESLMIGFGMLGRAELAFVVMDIAYVQNQILNTQAFFTLMITAFFLNVSVPLTIGWWRPHYDKAMARAARDSR
jgi:Kef-type K+ transport system membrane component KefB